MALGFGEIKAGDLRYSKLSLWVAGIAGLIPLELANHLHIPACPALESYKSQSAAYGM